MNQVGFYEQINELANRIPPESVTPPQAIEIDLEIAELARRVRTSPLPGDEKSLLMNRLLSARAKVVQNFRFPGQSIDRTFFNMCQNTYPAPLCPAYNQMAFPTLSNYHYQGSNLVAALLDPSALRCIPEKVLDMAGGDLEGKHCECMLTVIDARYLAARSDVLNFCAHRWAFPHTLFGESISENVLMGLYLEEGFEKIEGASAIAIRELKPMEVHAHLSGGTTIPEMVYSPNNAHFLINKEAPMGALWAVTRQSDRIGITKMIVLLKREHPISDALLSSTKNCTSLGDYLWNLRNVETAIDKSPYSEEKKSRWKALFTESPRQLLLESQTLDKGDNVLQMMKCALLFHRTHKEGLDLYAKLPEKGAVDFAFWELSGCPKKEHFGGDEFPKINTVDVEQVKLRAEAILLAASRELHRFSDNSPLDKSQFYAVLMDLVNSENFSKLAVLQKAEQINALMSRLSDEALRKNIYKLVHMQFEPVPEGVDWADQWTSHIADKPDFTVSIATHFIFP